MTDAVNGYKLECYQKIMAIGTNGNLWIVEDSVSKKRFVMRILSMESLQVFQRLSMIHHPNIVEINDIFTHDGLLYVIEEYLDLELLSDKIKTKTFSKNDVLFIGRQLFYALMALHENNIVHRDIKPENIMIDAQGNIKLIDFGIARLYEKGKSGDTTIKGSRDYAPPEQFGFAQSDQRTDIYSLGVTLNVLAVGKLPEYKMCSGILGEVIRHCIEFDPKKRYQSATEALKHIDWLEKRKIILVSVSVSVVSICFLMIAAIVFFKVSGFHEKESIFDSTDYRDRIISVWDYDRYPAFTMSENREYKFTTDLKEELKLTATATKADNQLFLSCKVSDGTTTDFVFDDVYLDAYKQQGYSNNTDFDKTSPDYEILIDDVDQDGDMDLLVTLAWRRWFNAPNPKYSYYLTEYSTLWVVYVNADNELAVSEPCYFDAYPPELEADTIIFNNISNEWYGFENGSFLSY